MADNGAITLIGADSVNPNEGWRNYTKRVPLGASKLNRDDLKRLYRLIEEAKNRWRVGEREIRPDRLWQTRWRKHLSNFQERQRERAEKRLHHDRAD